MSKEINLVLKEEAEGLRQKKRLKMFRLASFGSLLVVLLISLSIYLLNLRLESLSIEEQKNSLLSQLVPLRENEAKLKVINDRVNNISVVQENRNDVYKKVNSILGKAPVGMSVDSMEFTEGLILIKVSSDSLILVDDFINSLIEMAQNKETIKTLILNSLDVTATGVYSASINVGLI